MPAEKYPENMIEHLVRDPSDSEYGELISLKDPLPGGWFIDGARTPLNDDELLARALAAVRDKVRLAPTIWQGPMCWRTQHGPAIVSWLLGKPRQAWNVRLADARRTKALKKNYGMLWRRTADDPPRKYQTGKVEITENDVAFIDVDDPSPYEPPAVDGAPTLGSDLASDPAFVNALTNADFALAVVAEMSQVDYVRLDGGRTDYYYFRRDEAACLVAGLRGQGEEMEDFQYWDQMIPTAELNMLRDEVRKHLRRIGWRPDLTG